MQPLTRLEGRQATRLVRDEVSCIHEFLGGEPDLAALLHLFAEQVACGNVVEPKLLDDELALRA